MGNLGYENKDFDDIATMVREDLEAVKPAFIIPSSHTARTGGHTSGIWGLFSVRYGVATFN